MKKILLILMLGLPAVTIPQVKLEADGSGNTYELINSKFAPGYDAVEHPECIHPEFGRHIVEVWDDELKQYVFEFYSHVTPDNDRCINLDRQRIEIKTYDSSPANLKAVVGETVTYKWEFRLPVGFKPSSSFTHIHQIKAVGGDDDMPIFTLTPRKSSPNILELIHNNSTKVKTANLSLFEGVWVECTEVIHVHPTDGKYSLLINRVSDGITLLSYTNNKLMTIHADNNFDRPKWGIYRSLNNVSDLRDEAVRFTGFSIQEGVTGIEESGSSTPTDFLLNQNYPNPFNLTTVISYQLSAFSHTTLKVYDVLGIEIAVLVNEFKAAGNYNFQFSILNYQLISGVYFYQLKAGNFIATKKMLLLK